MSNADELLGRYVLRRYREDSAKRRAAGHLSTCPEVTVDHLEARDGTYGCETGCEYLRLEATLSCPHGESEQYEYGDFGDIAGIIDEMERLDRPAPTPQWSVRATFRFQTAYPPDTDVRPDRVRCGVCGGLRAYHPYLYCACTFRPRRVDP